ncbi:uncharacterized protein JN550_000551 [Neoarthrinium moseri]|uniref:uncharacterized protein n=1 Tax=Neoarthrinium moseri TaxID=1658444 RepID=UPI001FDB426B|nr:uncharacterized protein JN550_000551 [Neoarthrinium moseri]KAI1878369.1 hypothetical protein JN550_000551 [Neoarthrinium moseri]
MSSLGPQIGPVKRAWYRWKMLRLPWRKRFLVGLDLRGNTYWTFLDQRPDPSTPDAALRWRRIVQYPRSTHLSEVKVPPQWHQWLRHQREDAPSLGEQAADLARRERTRLLAAEADARWEAKPRVMDIPAAEREQLQRQQQQPAPALDTGDMRGKVMAEEGQRDTPRAATGTPADTAPGAKEGKTTEVKDDPWKRASGPSETWQPEAWTPSSARRR